MRKKIFVRGNKPHQSFMKSSIYDSDRLEKYSKILPHFTDVAVEGDEVRLGFEGDSMFPESYLTHRPHGFITKKDFEDGVNRVHITLDDGSVKIISADTISPYLAWEFTDDAFQKVLSREISKRENEQSFRGNGNDNGNGNEIENLRSEMNEFQSIVLSTLKEFADDIVRLDGDGNRAEFAALYSSAYTGYDKEEKMRGRATENESEASDEDSMSG